MSKLVFKCGYCGALYSHDAPAEPCPKRDGILPHAQGNLYKQNQPFTITKYPKRCKKCNYIWMAYYEENVNCPECKSGNVSIE